MSPVIRINYEETAEFIYANEKERDRHIEFMTMHDWKVGSQVEKPMSGVNIETATEEDCEWYGFFQRSKKLDFDITE